MFGDRDEAIEFFKYMKVQFDIKSLNNSIFSSIPQGEVVDKIIYIEGDSIFVDFVPLNPRNGRKPHYSCALSYS